MKEICLKDHTECSLCVQIKTPTFKAFNLSKGESIIDFWIEETTILFLMEGELQLSYNGYLNESLNGGEFILLPPACSIAMEVLEDSDIITCRTGTMTSLCENFSLESLIPYGKEIEEGNYYPLSANERISEFLNLQKCYLKDGLKCYYLYQMKTKEVLQLLRLYYGKKDLVGFFSPILGKDMRFKEQVLRNHYKARSVSELAELMNYSVSGFEKRFKKCFSQPAYSWMQQKKAESVLRELKENKQSIKEIASSYGFSSLARLYEFCKSHHGKTPGELRMQKSSN